MIPIYLSMLYFESASILVLSESATTLPVNQRSCSRKFSSLSESVGLLSSCLKNVEFMIPQMMSNDNYAIFEQS